MDRENARIIFLFFGFITQYTPNTHQIHTTTTTTLVKQLNHILDGGNGDNMIILFRSLYTCHTLLHNSFVHEHHQQHLRQQRQHRLLSLSTVGFRVP